MKKLFTLTVFLFIANIVAAQPWLDKVNLNEPQKLQDIIEAYKNNPTHFVDKDEEEADDNVSEDKDFQFDRWVWYWKSHTDINGYLVSPVKTLNEWQNYKAQKNIAAYASRLTSGVEANWQFEGPDTSAGHGYGLGRITLVAFHPTDSNTFWIGSAGGGAWKTSDAGNTWTPVNDNLPVLSISDIDFNPLNPNTIYLCTGDRDANYTYSSGVLKSTDGGITWDTTGLKWKPNQLMSANALIINPKDTNVLLLASGSGIYRSVNAGTSWTNVQTGSFMEIVYNPADTNVVYATTKSVTSFLGSTIAQIYRSADGGKTWNIVTKFTGTNRISLAVTAANPAIVKALVANSSFGLYGVYSSSDSGNTFNAIYTDSSCTKNILSFDPTLTASSCGGQGFYDLCITINPLDTNEIFAGGVNTWHSTDGGRSWNILNQWTNMIHGLSVIHADKHFLGYNPLTPTRLFETNDGGVYYSDNPALQWNDITNGMGLTQFYRLAVSNGTSAVLGGAQDNGCKMVNGKTYTELTGGDGMQVLIDYSNPDIVYTESQYGSINKSINGGLNFKSISRNIPGRPSGAWITPYVLHPQFPNVILAGYTRLYLSNDTGNTWKGITATSTTGSDIDRIIIAPSNPSYVYYLEDNTVYLSTNFNPSGGTPTFSRLNIPITGTISDIAVDPKDETHLWLTTSGYAGSKVGDYLPSRGTASWKSQAGTLPDLPVQCITIDSSNGTIYVGTDVAIFYRDSTMTDWALYNKGLPNVQVYDLEINYTANEIWTATYGRGIWMSPKHLPSAPINVSIVPFANDIVTVSPNPNNGQFEVSTKNSSFLNKEMTIRLVNESGVTCWSNTKTFDNAGKISIDATGLTRGIYILEASGNNVVARARIVIY